MRIISRSQNPRLPVSIKKKKKMTSKENSIAVIVVVLVLKRKQTHAHPAVADGFSQRAIHVNFSSFTR